LTADELTRPEQAPNEAMNQHDTSCLWAMVDTRSPYLRILDILDFLTTDPVPGASAMTLAARASSQCTDLLAMTAMS
jgi:hypothetical protein